MSPEGQRVPHNHAQYKGRWALSLGHELFKIEETHMVGDEPSYEGTGLRGQRVQTAVPSILTRPDHQILEEKL